MIQMPSSNDDLRQPIPLHLCIAPVVESCRPMPFVQAMDMLRDELKYGWADMSVNEMLDELRGED